MPGCWSGSDVGRPPRPLPIRKANKISPSRASKSARETTRRSRAGLCPVIPLSVLPTLNATLNATSAVLLVTGYVFIRRRQVTAHKTCMVSAFLVSTLFLSSYLYYHYYHGATPFPGRGVIRVIYFSILIPHVVLAVAILPLALVTLYRAWREQFDRHKRIARWTLPLWLFVSVTGVVVYWMLYHLYPAP
ncbi:MAG: DUF420 domain-containing protein [Acidobacteria bacterium]|nr:DUF420 domain-containing protein [Acidobacteriota bacterium]